MWDIKNQKRIVSRNVDFFENLDMSTQQSITKKPNQKTKRKFALGSNRDSKEDSTSNDTLPVNDKATVKDVVEDEIFFEEDMELDESVSIDPNFNQVQFALSLDQLSTSSGLR